jgi:hypothetical protein
MTSLGEVYGGEGRRETSLRRLYAGSGLFSLGVLLVVAGIVVATTDVVRGNGVTLFQAREYAGVLAGVGVPAVFLGILTVLPSDRNTRLAAGVGAAIAVLGVALFTHAYPCRWSGANCAPGLPNLTLPTVGVYFLGALIAFWYLFVGVANFKRRNDPGGTVEMEVTRQGETRVVEVDPRKKGSVGFGSETPSGDAPTQTAPTGTGGAAHGSDAEVWETESEGATNGAPTGGAAASDGGAAADDIRSFDDERVERTSVPGDPYCGNCRHFEYVRTERGMQPYCTHHGEEMDDMDPCEAWTPRTEG